MTGQIKASSFRGEANHKPWPVAVIEAPLLKELAGDETQRRWLCSASGIPSHRPSTLLLLLLLGMGGSALLAQEFPLLVGAGSPLGDGADPAVLAEPL